MLLALLVSLGISQPSLNINLEIHKLLEKCRFGRFWEELQAEHDMIIEFNGFEDAIRSYICGVISISFQRLSLENLKEFLGLANTQDVTEWIEKYGWTRDQGTVFVASQEEKVKVNIRRKTYIVLPSLFQSKSIVERVDLESLVPVMSLGARKIGK